MIGATKPAAPVRALTADNVRSVTGARTQHKVDALTGQFGPLFDEIKGAMNDPDKWEDVTKRSDYRRLLMKLKLATMSEAPENGALIAAVAKATQMNPVELTELKGLDVTLLQQGKWMPQTARMRRMAKESAAADNEPVDPTQDFVTRGLSRASRAKIPFTNKRFVPGVKEMDASGMLRGVYKMADRALPYIDKAGEAAAGQVDKLTNVLEKIGDEMATDIQKQYRQMHNALDPLGVSEKKLRGYTEPERQMVLAAGAALHDLAVDVDAWMEILMDPDKRKDKTLLGRAKAGARFTVDSLAKVVGGSAKTLRALTDEDSWRLFNVNMVGGGGLMVATCAIGGGIGLFFPSLQEVNKTDKVKVRTDAAYPAITTPFGGAMLNSRGGKWNVKTPLLGVRRSEYSQAVKFGIPFLFGVSVHRDKVFGSGVELALFPKIGYTGIFDVRGGGNVVVFHPGLRGLDKPVRAIADALGDGMEWIGDHVKIVTTPLAKLGRKALEGMGWMKPKEKLEGDDFTKKQLGRKILQATKGTVVLGVIDAYKKHIAAQKAAGRPFGDNDAFKRLTRGFSDGKAEGTIEDFLKSSGERLEGKLEELKKVVESTDDSPLAARKRNVQIRTLSREIEQHCKIFEYVDMVMCQAFPGVEPKPAGPFKDLVTMPGSEKPESAVPGRDSSKLAQAA